MMPVDGGWDGIWNGDWLGQDSGNNYLNLAAFIAGEGALSARLDVPANLYTGGWDTAPKRRKVTPKPLDMGMVTAGRSRLRGSIRLTKELDLTAIAREASARASVVIERELAARRDRQRRRDEEALLLLM
jgi:hypothetical protein